MNPARTLTLVLLALTLTVLCLGANTILTAQADHAATLDGQRIESLLLSGKTTGAQAALQSSAISKQNNDILLRVENTQKLILAQLRNHQVSLEVVCSIAGFLKDKDAVVLSNCREAP